MRDTRQSEPRVKAAGCAAGLHYPEKRRTYFFDDISHDQKPRSRITIGRGPKCHIQIFDPYLSVVHAVLRRRKDGVMWLHDKSSTNGVYVDGEQLKKPIALRVGMQIKLGHTVLIAVDQRGKFPVYGTTVSDFCRNATTLYGSMRLAGKHVGRSHTFIRSQHAPREERQRTATTEEDCE